MEDENKSENQIGNDEILYLYSIFTIHIYKNYAVRDKTQRKTAFGIYEENWLKVSKHQTLLKYRTKSGHVNLVNSWKLWYFSKSFEIFNNIFNKDSSLDFGSVTCNIYHIWICGWTAWQFLAELSIFYIFVCTHTNLLAAGLFPYLNDILPTGKWGY